MGTLPLTPRTTPAPRFSVLAAGSRLGVYSRDVLRLLPHACAGVSSCPLDISDAELLSLLDPEGVYTASVHESVEGLGAGVPPFAAGDSNPTHAPMLPGTHVEVAFLGPFDFADGARYFIAVILEVATCFMWVLRLQDLGSRSISALVHDVQSALLARPSGTPAAPF